MTDTKKILSFDVGIINLAYCLLEIDETKQTFTIIKWDTIDLADNRSTCSFTKNTGEMCDKIARYTINIENSYYCKAHVIKAKLNIKPIELNKWAADPDDIDQCSLCEKNGEYYFNFSDNQYCKTHQKTILEEKHYLCATKKCFNLISKGVYVSKTDKDDEVYDELITGWCSDHFDNESKLYLKKKTKKISQNSNKISLLSIGSSMYQKLDNLPELLNVDTVLIENQPTLINPTMKSVSSMLFSYFIMRGIHEKNKTKSLIKHINFCSPSNKITVGGKAVCDKIDEAKDNKVYKLTKSLSVKICKALLNNEWLTILESHKKQDDMADALLQCIVRVFGNVLPDHYSEKLKNISD